MKIVIDGGKAAEVESVQCKAPDGGAVFVSTDDEDGGLVVEADEGCILDGDRRTVLVIPPNLQ